MQCQCANDIDDALEFVRRCRDEVVQLPLVSWAQTIVLWDLSDVLFVRDHDRVQIFLNGDPQPEIQSQSPADFPAQFDQLFFGGRSDRQSNWEGRLDEIAVFDRPLTADDIKKLAVQ